MIGLVSALASNVALAQRMVRQAHILLQIRLTGLRRLLVRPVPGIVRALTTHVELQTWRQRRGCSVAYPYAPANGYLPSLYRYASAVGNLRAKFRGTDVTQAKYSA